LGLLGADGVIPEPDRKVLMSPVLMDEWASRDADGYRLTWDWGEPDASGCYTPTITRHNDDRLGELDAAWAEAEAALPKHWRLGIDPYYPSGWESYAYDIRRTPTSGLTKHSSGACYGEIPAAALRALAVRLRETRP
jgi:hypothetical protein